MADDEDPLALLRAAIPKMHELIAGITPAQWSAPTPCDDMDVAASVQTTLALARRYDDDDLIRVPGMFGPAISVPPDASAIDRLAGFLGRRP